MYMVAHTDVFENWIAKTIDSEYTISLSVSLNEFSSIQ